MKIKDYKGSLVQESKWSCLLIIQTHNKLITRRFQSNMTVVRHLVFLFCSQLSVQATVHEVFLSIHSLMCSHHITSLSQKLSQTFVWSKYLHSHGIHLQWSMRQILQIFSNEFHWSRNGKFDFVFFIYFLRVIGHFSINIRIEEHFLWFALRNERTLDACKSLRSALCFSRFTRDPCPFISQCKQKRCTLILK